MSMRKHGAWRAHACRDPVAGAGCRAEPYVRRSSVRAEFSGQCERHHPARQGVSDNNVLWHCEHRWSRPRYPTLNATSTTPVSSACPTTGLVSAFTYQATTTFELSDGSTLVLNESGLVCAPGNSQSAPPQSFGFPEYATSSWTVTSASGAFSGLTGAGTDALRAAGANNSGTYSGT